MKEQKLQFPAHYGVICEKEMATISGGIGPTALDDGKYATYEKASFIAILLENMLTRIFKPSYSDRQNINKGLAGIGIVQAVINIINPSAIAKAINFAPVLTGFVDTLGKIGLSRI